MAGVLRREGEYWTIAVDGRLIRLRHSKGLGYLSRLVQSPERRLHVDELLGVAQPAGCSRLEGDNSLAANDRKRVAVTKALRSALRKVKDHDPFLGELFERAVKTGTFCAYVPGPGCPTSWER